MLGLMTVKRHREIVVAMEAEHRSRIAAKDMINRSLREESATLRAQLPKRGEGGKFVGRAG